MEPVRGQVKKVTRAKNHLVGVEVGKFGPLFQVRVGPVDAVGGILAGWVEIARVTRVAARGMTERKKVPTRNKTSDASAIGTKSARPPPPHTITGAAVSGRLTCSGTGWGGLGCSADAPRRDR